MRLPSGLSRGLQIAAFEKEIEKEKERQETMNVLLESNPATTAVIFLSGIRRLTMFRVQFTHFYASSWS